MSTGTEQSTAGNDDAELEAAEHERQLRELLDFCPAALSVVDEDGRLVFHNARLSEILGYTRDELHLCDTRLFWHFMSRSSSAFIRPSARSTPGWPAATDPPPSCGTQPQQRLLRLDPDRTAKRRWFKSLVIRARSPRFGVIHGSRCVRSCTIVMLPLVVGTWPARHGRDFRQPSCRTCRSPAEF
jgi:PAS domain-containing protein